MFAFKNFLCNNKNMKTEFMKEALKLAEKAKQKGEVPIGAVVVKDGKIISKGFNKRESKQNALLHAEIEAIHKACKKLKSWRLDGCEIYVTLEPCLMCLGAILNARINYLCFGAIDKSNGSLTANPEILNESKLNHNLKFESGILEKECSNILTSFFKEIRKNKKNV